MSEPKRVLRPMADMASPYAPKSLSEAPARSATVIAFGMVAVISMLFGFVIGLLF